jgi:hypothetical protein
MPATKEVEEGAKVAQIWAESDTREANAGVRRVRRGGEQGAQIAKE